MNEPLKRRIFAGIDRVDFVGRRAQLKRLLQHATSTGESNGLALLSTPSAGASELLRQVYDPLFTDQDAVIPFYFEFRSSDGTAQNAALRFLREFILQTVAFRRQDARIIDASPEISELAELALPSDGYWIDRLVEIYSHGDKLSDDPSFIRNCVSAPLRAAGNGARSMVMIDNTQAATKLEGGNAFLDDLLEIFARSPIPFVFAGHRRFLFARANFQTIHLETFSFLEAGKFAETLSVRTGVAINDQTRDLIAVQLGGSARHIESLFVAADDGDSNLSTFGEVEKVYTDEVFGGHIGRHFGAVIDNILPDADVRDRVLRLLTENMSVLDGKLTIAYWKQHMQLDGSNFDAALNALNHHELVNVGSGWVGTDKFNIVFSDYLNGRNRLEIEGRSRALTVGEAFTENAKRAPQLMARFYRRNSAIGLRTLLKAFDGRKVSAALIDYEKFRDEFKGAGDEKIMVAVNEDAATIILPQILYTAHTATLYPKLDEVCDTERSAVALGFSEKEEIAWIAVEIDSKLEATRDEAEFWCDRLEMVALDCNFSHYKLWLIAPEGFNRDAMEVLRTRNAYGSSRNQVNLLAANLKADMHPGPENTGNEYEVVVPMGDDTEMIAARTIEEVAKRHNFSAKAINQIKTALVEACINATEHSLSPDRRIYQKFVVGTDKITITVSNRGVRIGDKNASGLALDEGRRGWGLKLIRGLMDEVELQETDDGTSITMIKYLKSATVN